ncbi:tannase and feruloyl esterase-domain-containing protein [Xylariales sp. AK1849]|nr:tannase and feruloyl esterase-domain-containing protein [Xylariales sp. AK1849]
MLNNLVRWWGMAVVLGARLGTAQTLADCRSNASSVTAVLAGILPANASIERVDYVESGSTYGEAGLDLNYPTQPTNLPELCAVTVYVPSSATSAYRFGVFLPLAWNSRFLTIGNGGFGGGINWLDMGSYVKYGFAVVSTDTGHNSTTGDVSWAYQAPQKKIDWGWRAMHGSVVTGKQVVEAYYASKIAYSYYNGCSTGGRQGLKEVQISPDSFDGVIIGSPGWYTSHLNTWITKAGTYNLPETDPKYIDWQLFPAMNDLVVKQCDQLDGVKDGIISLPDACVPDYTEMLCSRPGANQSACLTAEQLQTPKNVYSDYLASNGQFLYPGLSPGCEGQWQAVLNFTTTSPFGYNYLRFMLLENPAWNYTYYNDSLVSYAVQTDPGFATANDYNLTAFKNLGHKMIMYHGLGDGLIPPKGTDMYYNNVITTMGDNLTATQEFFRYFQVPGMQHCWTTATDTVDAPWMFGGEFQATSMGTDVWSVPGFKDKRHDILLALMDWVENGTAVESIIATTWEQPLNYSSGLRRQRPLCPYPQMATWNGVDINNATSWNCSGKSVLSPSPPPVTTSGSPGLLWNPLLAVTKQFRVLGLT